MKPKEFFDLVVEMRRHQIEYARSNGRDRREQTYARDLERKVDTEIKRVKDIEAERMKPRLDFTQ